MSESIIQIQHLNKTFGTGETAVHALEDINLDIRRGEIFGIIGLSGAGKSTLVRCMNLLERPTSGSITVNGQRLAWMEGEKLTTISERELRLARRNVTMIFQSFNLLMQRTCLQNVCFPMEIAHMDSRKAKERAKELLKLVGLEERMNAYPAQLSGGQKQRVAIARAMATNPRVLLCDEATSALDPNTTKSILELLKKINREMGITVIMITHEMAVIEAICDRVAIIDHSHIAESGKVSDIFSGPKSDIGRQLILGDTSDQTKNFGGSRMIRVIFDGRESSEPIIANMILACKAPVNIMHADTRDIEGKAMGQMLLQLPEDTVDADRICNYLRTAGVTFEEVH